MRKKRWSNVNENEMSHFLFVCELRLELHKQTRLLIKKKGIKMANGQNKYRRLFWYDSVCACGLCVLVCLYDGKMHKLGAFFSLLISAFWLRMRRHRNVST